MHPFLHVTEARCTSQNTITALLESRERWKNSQDNFWEKKQKPNHQTTKLCFDTWLKKFDWKQATAADTICHWELEAKSVYFLQGNYSKIIPGVLLHYFFSYRNRTVSSSLAEWETVALLYKGQLWQFCVAEYSNSDQPDSSFQQNTCTVWN